MGLKKVKEMHLTAVEIERLKFLKRKKQ